MGKEEGRRPGRMVRGREVWGSCRREKRMRIRVMRKERLGREKGDEGVVGEKEGWGVRRGRRTKVEGGRVLRG